jgi:putative ribosome biogenesis GTPase RsgA
MAATIDSPSWTKLQSTSQVGHYIVFMGQLGAGKSTLLNCLAGTASFAAAHSRGFGVTKKNSTVTFQGINLIDTPGLLDPQSRETAGMEVKDALCRGGLYNLCCGVP